MGGENFVLRAFKTQHKILMIMPQMKISIPACKEETVTRKVTITLQWKLCQKVGLAWSFGQVVGDFGPGWIMGLISDLLCTAPPTDWLWCEAVQNFTCTSYCICICIGREFDLHQSKRPLFQLWCWNAAKSAMWYRYNDSLLKFAFKSILHQMLTARSFFHSFWVRGKIHDIWEYSNVQSSFPRENKGTFTVGKPAAGHRKPE